MNLSAEQELRRLQAVKEAFWNHTDPQADELDVLIECLASYVHPLQATRGQARGLFLKLPAAVFGVVLSHGLQSQQAKEAIVSWMQEQNAASIKVILGAK